MAVLSFNDLAKEYAGEYIFTNLNGTIQDKTVVGITGPNGIGKTTLLQLLSGIQESSGGTINKKKNLKIGYLQQEAIQAFAARENSVFDEMHTVFSGLKEQQEKLHELELRLSEESTESLLEEYGKRQEAFEQAGGYCYEHKIEKTLEGLGFGKKDWHMPLTHCSGGQKTRALLARLLLEEPDLLILDEPTNHLDAGAVEWLEGTLLRWEKSIIIVSHDRYFLDVLAREIWEMNSYGLEKFKGNYTAYQKQRRERRERREKTFNATIEFFLKELHYIKRYIDKKTDQAKGRHKRLVRHVKAVEVGGPEVLDMKWNEFCLSSGGISGTKWSVRDTEQHIRELQCRNPYTKPMKMKFPCSGHFPHKVADFRKLKVGYGSNAVCSVDSAEILDSRRIALIGPNGCGKSTLLRTLLGEIPSLGGEIKTGSGITAGYFAQAHDLIDHDKTVLEIIMDSKNGLFEAEARNYLGRFLFSNDDVFKRAGTLSGGERSRLTLAIMALEKINFLVLDEPTNHLDIQSREILEDALTDFPGAILLVSHDRYLVGKLATDIWSVENGEIVTFKGPYSKFVESRSKESPGRQEGTVVRNDRKAAGKQAINRNPERKKMTPIEREKEIGRAEKNIIGLEKELDEISMNIEEAVSARNQNQIKEWNNRYMEVKKQIQVLLETWEKLSTGGLV